jgi:hypothetical protein
MKTSRIFIATALLTLPLIAGLAWYVASTPSGDGGRSEAGNAAGQAPVPHRSANSDAADPFPGQPRPEQPQPALHAAQDSPAHGGDAAASSALSVHMAYGPRKAEPSHARKTAAAAAAGGTIPASLPSEVLDTSRVAMPLALLDPVPSTTASPEQTAALNKLRNDFADAVGGPKQDTQSKAYRDNWTAAQPGADQHYRLWFGDHAYMAQQLAQHLDKQAAR